MYCNIYGYTNYTTHVVPLLFLYVKEAVVALQAPRHDLVSNVALIEQCCTELKQLRSNVDYYSLRIFQHST